MEISCKIYDYKNLDICYKEKKKTFPKMLNDCELSLKMDKPRQC